MSFLTELQKSLLGPVLVELKAQEQHATIRHKEMKEDLTRITTAVQGISDRVDQAIVIVKDERDLIAELKKQLADPANDVTPELTELAVKLEAKNAEAAAALNPPPPPG